MSCFEDAFGAEYPLTHPFFEDLDPTKHPHQSLDDLQQLSEDGNESHVITFDDRYGRVEDLKTWFEPAPESACTKQETNRNLFWSIILEYEPPEGALVSLRDRSMMADWVAITPLLYTFHPPQTIFNSGLRYSAVEPENKLCLTSHRSDGEETVIAEEIISRIMANFKEKDMINKIDELTILTLPVSEEMRKLLHASPQYAKKLDQAKSAILRVYWGAERKQRVIRDKDMPNSVQDTIRHS